MKAQLTSPERKRGVTQTRRLRSGLVRLGNHDTDRGRTTVPEWLPEPRTAGVDRPRA